MADVMVRKLASGKSSRQIVIFEKRFEVPDYDNPNGIPSRVRWRLIHTPWFGIYLHKWIKPDPRKTFHNHPWPFLSIILSGAYLEKRINGERWVWWFNLVRRKDFHTVTTILPNTWSLMLVGRDRGTWGYLDPDYIPFDQHRHSKEFQAAMNARNGSK